MSKNIPVRSFVFGVIILSVFAFSGLALGEVAPIPPKDKFPSKNTFQPIVQKVIDEDPQRFNNRYEPSANPTGTWDFLEEVVKKLREKDARFAFNGKRGNLDSPSHDVVSYYWGPGSSPQEGYPDVYKVYVIDITSWGKPTAQWHDSTDYQGCVLGAYLYPRTNSDLQPGKPDKPSGCVSGTSAPPPGGGGGTGGGGGDTGGKDEPIVPVGATVFPGKNPSLAFDPAKRLWLVVGENGGKIQGQLMTERAKPSGSVLNIATGTNPRVAHGGNGFLVIWTAGDVLRGQLLSDSGAASGAVFNIGANGTKIQENTTLQFDATNQQFVIAYENRNNIAVATISTSGIITGPAAITDKLTVGGNQPSLAIGSDGSYCVSYLNGTTKLFVRSVRFGQSAALGTPFQIAEAEKNVGIISTQDGYLPAWVKDNSIYVKNISTCADNPDEDPYILVGLAHTGVLSRNTGTYAVYALDVNGTNDRVVTFDEQGNQLSTLPAISGLWKNKSIALTANSLQGTYGVVGSPDDLTVKLVSNIGGQPLQNRPPALPDGSQNLPIPNRGLPTDLGQMIEAIFSWSISLIGLVIFVRFFQAGFMWFTATGREGQIREAKTIMKNALYGALVLFSAFLILNTINPDLVRSTFNLPGLPGAHQ